MPVLLVIEGSRWKAAMLAVVSAVLLLLIWSARNLAVGAWATWFGVALFGGGAILALKDLLLPQRLLLDAQGLTFRGAFRARRLLRWTEVESFFVWRVPSAPFSSMVVYILASSRGSDSAGAAVSRSLSGGDGGLPPGWAMPPDKLAAILNEYRERFGRDEGTAAAADR